MNPCPFDEAQFRVAVLDHRIQWRKHALQKMAERGIARTSVKEVLAVGERIRDYGDDRPFPSALFLGYIDGIPLHVVAAFDAQAATVYVITVYVPSEEQFEADHRTRRPR